MLAETNVTEEELALIRQNLQIGVLVSRDGKFQEYEKDYFSPRYHRIVGAWLLGDGDDPEELYWIITNMKDDVEVSRMLWNHMTRETWLKVYRKGRETTMEVYTTDTGEVGCAFIDTEGKGIDRIIPLRNGYPRYLYKVYKDDTGINEKECFDIPCPVTGTVLQEEWVFNSPGIGVKINTDITKKTGIVHMKTWVYITAVGIVWEASEHRGLESPPDIRLGINDRYGEEPEYLLIHPIHSSNEDNYLIWTMRTSLRNYNIRNDTSYYWWGSERLDERKKETEEILIALIELGVFPFASLEDVTLGTEYEPQTISL
ncbi:MAG: hypothetical protein HXS44_04705 [Theionarchaea archaeon]|nr:hypothetical protein [Theionarchaea archaeon]